LGIKPVGKILAILRTVTTFFLGFNKKSSKRSSKTEQQHRKVPEAAALLGKKDSYLESESALPFPLNSQFSLVLLLHLPPSFNCLEMDV
jgi:hypothetical protein